MKLEYIDDLTAGGKYPFADPKSLVRLYDFDPAEINELCLHIQRVIQVGAATALSSLRIIQPVNCNLLFRISTENKGLNTDDGRMFYCDLKTEMYEQMIDLLKPFAHTSVSGYQWLYDLDIDIDLLISRDGSW